MSSLASYYRNQSSRGVGPLSATLQLPRHGAQYLWNNCVQPPVRGDVIHGFGLYRRPLLASYSRSGTNWLRYIIETLSGRPTPGQVRVVAGRRYLIDRAHRAFAVMPRYRQVILVVRDYRECLVRHHRKHWRANPDAFAFLTDTTLPQPAEWYIRNIQAFDAFAGPKLLLYYEDLLQRPEDPIRNLARFLRLGRRRTERFIERLDEHFDHSVQAYTRGGHTSESASNRDPHHHAHAELTPHQMAAFDDFYFHRYPDLARRYLTRYDSRSSAAPWRPAAGHAPLQQAA